MGYPAWKAAVMFYAAQEIPVTHTEPCCQPSMKLSLEEDYLAAAYRSFISGERTGIRSKKPHSVESPSMVDPQWDIWYWWSKWNLHTVCWSAVGCEWGTTSVYFGITYVCFIPSRLPVFAVELQYLLQDFLFLSKVSFELHIQNLQKI